MFVMIAIAWAALLPTTGHAETDCASAYSAYQDYKKKTDRPSDYDAEVRRRFTAIQACERTRTATTGNCEEAKTDYTASITKFQDACKEADIPTSPDPGAIACSAKAAPMSSDEGRKACACTAKNLGPKDRFDMQCKDRSEYPSQLTAQCPDLNDAAAERQQRQIERLEDKIEKLKDKQEKAEDTAGQTTDKASEKAAQARKDKAAADKEYYQAIQQARKAKSDAQQQMIQSMNAVQEKIFGVQQKLTESKQADAQAYSALRKQQIEIELNCTQQATQAVNAMATEAITHIKDGTYNRGSQNDLFRQVGLTDRQSWQQQAAIKKKWCMDSEATHDSQTSAQMAYQDSLKAQGAVRQQAYDEIAMYNQQLAQIQTPNGACTAKAASGAMVQTQACKDQQDAADAILLAGKNRQSAYKQANADRDDADAAAKRVGDAIKTRADKGQAELKDMETELAAMKSAQRAGASYPNAGGKEGEIKKLDITMDKLMQQAGRANMCCLKSGQQVFAQNTCDQAKRFLITRGFDESALTRADDRSTIPPRDPNAGQTFLPDGAQGPVAPTGR